MDYKVTKTETTEVHTIELHKLDLIQSAGHLNVELYTQYRRSPIMAERCLALALIVKAIEDFKAESASEPQPENVVPINGHIPTNGSG